MGEGAEGGEEGGGGEHFEVANWVFGVLAGWWVEGWIGFGGGGGGMVVCGWLMGGKYKEGGRFILEMGRRGLRDGVFECVLMRRAI